MFLELRQEGEIVRYVGDLQDISGSISIQIFLRHRALARDRQIRAALRTPAVAHSPQQLKHHHFDWPLQQVVQVVLDRSGHTLLIRDRLMEQFRVLAPGAPNQNMDGPVSEAVEVEFHLTIDTQSYKNYYCNY